MVIICITTSFAAIGFRLRINDVKALNTELSSARFLKQNEGLALAGKISKEAIDFLTRQIKAVENVVKKEWTCENSISYHARSS